jgi:hypothetical protein
MCVLLLHPPAVKPAGPPLGPAVLLGHLRRHGMAASALDAGLDALHYLLDPDRLAAAAGPQPSTALQRALRNLPRAMQLLRSPAVAVSFDRYRSAVEHLNRALSVYRGASGDERLTLGDYRHERLSEFSPADLESLAAGVEKTLFGDYFREALLPQVAARRPRLIAMSINYRHQVLPAFELAGLLRRLLPEVILIAGGGMISSWQAVLGQSGLRLGPFDHLVTGPGEGPLLELAKGGKEPDYLLADGSCLGWLPDYSGLEPRRYLSPEPVLPLTVSRGCYWARCLFCPEAATPTHPYAAYKPRDLPRLLRELAERWQVRHFHLTDNAVPPAALRALADGADDLAGLAWYGFVRFEPELLEGDLIEGVARAGCRMLQLGLESGSQEVLDRLAKGTRLEVVSEVLRRLRRAGIASYVYVLLGTPGETLEEAQRTRDFLEEHAGEIDFLNLAIMNLPRESVLDGEGAPPNDDEEPLGLYRPVDEQAEQRRAARRFLQQELLTSPAIRAIVQRTPPLFTSDHAMFFGSKG